MNYGLYISASGMSAQMARQDVLSNNLANVNTTAFKPDLLAIRQRDMATREDATLPLDSNRLLERLGAGVMPTATRVNASPAPLESTGNPLDLGVEGEGYFLVRAGPGNEGVRLTRDGRFTLSPDGALVTAAEGRPVLDETGQRISIDPTRQVIISAAGDVQQDGQTVARLALANVPDPASLVKEGGGLFRTSGPALSLPRATGVVKQGMVESSGTNSINAMMAVTSASRAVESNATIIGYINDLMGRAINTLGRVA